MIAIATKLELTALTTAEQDSSNLTQIYDAGDFTAYAEDMECMWRWTIYRDHKLVQEGCSLTFDASKRAVNHVMAFFNRTPSGAF
jgi:methane monooxygenase component D